NVGDEVYAQYRSRIHEGDEIVTDKNSMAWVMLIDGTLLRISPNSSISFNDVNLSKQQTQFFMRLNYGHVYIQPRFSGKFEAQDMAETDGAFLPLLEKTANREFYMIQEY